MEQLKTKESSARTSRKCPPSSSGNSEVTTKDPSASESRTRSPKSQPRKQGNAAGGTRQTKQKQATQANPRSRRLKKAFRKQGQTAWELSVFILLPRVAVTQVVAAHITKAVYTPLKISREYPSIRPE